ncbi:MAG: hypothetical protein R3F07_13615 [Opitutaceae bacterium]
MATRISGRLAAILFTACGLALNTVGSQSAPTGPNPPAPLDTAVLTYTAGDDFSAFADAAESLRGASPEEKRATEDLLLLLLQNPGATQAARVEILALLELAAGPASVEPVGRLLTDPVLSFSARRVLQDLDSPLVNPILLAAVRETRGEMRIGMIGSLGHRHALEAVEPLAALASSADLPTARAALRALAETGNIEAAAALIETSVDPEVENDQLDALLLIGESLRRKDFTNTAGAIAELLIAPSYPVQIRLAAYLLLARTIPENSADVSIRMLESGEPELIAGGLSLVAAAQPADATRRFAALMTSPGIPTVALLEALVARGDIAARSAILSLTNSDDTDFRAAALEALGVLGSPEEVNLLIARLQAGKEESRAARTALVRLPQLEVDVELLRRYRTFEEPPASELAGILGDRSNRAAVPFMLEAALRPDKIGRESVRALASLAEPSDVPELIALLDLVPSGFRRGVEQAVAAAMNRSDLSPPSLDPVLGSYAAAGPDNRLSLLRIAGAIGGPEASAKFLDVFRNGPPAERETVQGILATTTDSRYLETLRILTAGTDDPSSRTVFIRSVLRLSEKLPNWKADDAVDIIASVAPLAQSREEKNMIIEAASERPTPAALEIIQGFLDDPELAGEARAAAAVVSEALSEDSQLP